MLLDVHLPDISGLEVLERLRAQGHSVAVVMVTAERGAAAVRAALHGGAMQYLVKPFEYDDLADRLRRVAAALASLPPTTASSTSTRPRSTRPSVRAGPAATYSPLCRRVSAPRPPTSCSPPRRRQSEISASEAAEAVGLSRVTARRYLEHFVDTGTAEVRLQYGGTGRPERRYRVGGRTT